jgi:hypothetical protein
MRYIQYILLVICILGGITIIYAQEECDIDTAQIVNVVESVCTGLDGNQVCYGNYEVGTDLIEDIELPDFNFDSPGDLADLLNIESIYLSALNPEDDTWGIAQMLLLASTSKGVQELNLLLFGDVEVENTVDPTIIVEVQVGIHSANIRNLPSVDALTLQSVEAGLLLEAIGRLADNSWVRVRMENGAIGWITTQLVAPINEDEAIEDLEIQDSSTPYFGPMQAFYFSQGSGSACNNITSNGLLIQTPQGPASVTISINGVSIDLIPGNTGATILVQADDDSMSISMITGSGYIESNNTGYYLDPTEQTTISLDENGNATGLPSLPTTYDNDLIDNLPLLPLVDTSIPSSDNTANNNSNLSTDTGDSSTTDTNSDSATDTGDSSTTDTNSDSATNTGGSSTTDTNSDSATNTGDTSITSDECNANDNANPNACNKEK